VHVTTSNHCLRGAAEPMPTVAPAFVPKNGFIYRVWVGELRFDAPLCAESYRSRYVAELIDPCTVDLRALPATHWHRPRFPRRLTAILESRAAQVHDTVRAYPLDTYIPLCVDAVLAWHLIDSHASVGLLVDELDFTRIDVALWAALAVFRNMSILRDHISQMAVSFYMESVFEIVAGLRTQGFVVHPVFRPP